MDALYPGAKFILTVRDEDKWLASNLKHFGTDPLADARADLRARPRLPEGP